MELLTTPLFPIRKVANKTNHRNTILRMEQFNTKAIPFRKIKLTPLNDCLSISKLESKSIKKKQQEITFQPQRNYINKERKIIFNKLKPITLKEPDSKKPIIKEQCITTPNKRLFKKPLVIQIKSQEITYKLKSFFSLTQPGGVGPQTNKNQDALLEKHRMNDIPYYHCFGVFDGHGQYGSLISYECSKYFTKAFIDISNTNSKNDHALLIKDALINDNYAIIKDLFNNTMKVLKEKDIDTSFSGTTANILVLIQNKLLCANVGDSRAIAVTIDNIIIPLTKDNRPESPSELERITRMKGNVRRLEGITIGPLRIWVNNETYPGLAMSRSLGDEIAEDIGVISEPMITEYNLHDLKPKYIISATDGLWDVISNEDVSKIINPFYIENNPQGAAKALSQKAKRNWKRDNNERYDDITIIILFF